MGIRMPIAIKNTRARVVRAPAIALSLFAVLLAPLSAFAAIPKISGTPPSTIKVGSWYNFIATVSDADGDTLTCSIKNQPFWIVFNKTRCQISDIPTSAEVGTYSNIIMTVSDGKGGTASLPPFSITVTSGSTSGNLPPKISGTPPSTIKVGSWYNFIATVSDPNGDTVTCSIKNQPFWIVFNKTRCQVSDIPTSAEVGTYSNIIMTVSDGKGGTASLPPFSITVTTGSTTNQPPTISGTPPTSVQTGVAYAFTPTAKDPEGKTLTFSITNKPVWATFSTTTGKLSGTPSSAQTGTYSNIQIKASDGSLTASLPDDDHRLRDAELDAADSEHGRFVADEPRGLPDPVRHQPHGADAHGAACKSGPLALCRREPCGRHVVLQRAVVLDRRRGELRVECREHERTLNRRWRRRSGLEPT
jgi:hypothetical protein